MICFELVPILNINLAKSVLVPFGEVSNVGVLAEVLGCEVGSLPIPYLGMPLGSRFKDKANWNGVVEKSIRTLARWKRLYLSRVVGLRSLKVLCPTSLLISYLCYLCQLWLLSAFSQFNLVFSGEVWEKNSSST
jgi:hypothetical protein